MSVVTRQIGPCFAAEVEGIDMTKPLSPDEVAAIHAGMDRYAVLVFHDQQIDDEQQLAFTRSLGEIELAIGTSLRAAERVPSADDVRRRVEPRPESTRCSPATTGGVCSPIGNRLWHSDSSFKVVPAKYSLLHARAIPSKGGNTEFAYMRGGLRRARRRDQGPGRGPDLRALADLLAPAARLHRLHRRGARALQAGAPASRARASRRPGASRSTCPRTRASIVGWPVPEARFFLRDLIEHATQREFVYAHKWRVGDLVMWDNRQTMHRARPFPAHEPRDMRRTTLMGDGPTVAQAAA